MRKLENGNEGVLGKQLENGNEGVLGKQLENGNEGVLGKQLEIIVWDEPGVGGACHEYEVRLSENHVVARVSFQNGGIQESGNGANGCSNEALLAILIDRMSGFQSGQFSNEETSIALEHCEKALTSLEARTKERAARGVEGKHLK